jgi:hypothetical protein
MPGPFLLVVGTRDHASSEALVEADSCAILSPVLRIGLEIGRVRPDLEKKAASTQALQGIPQDFVQGSSDASLPHAAVYHQEIKERGIDVGKVKRKSESKHAASGFLRCDEQSPLPFVALTEEDGYSVGIFAVDLAVVAPENLLDLGNAAGFPIGVGELNESYCHRQRSIASTRTRRVAVNLFTTLGWEADASFPRIIRTSEAGQQVVWGWNTSGKAGGLQHATQKEYQENDLKAAHEELRPAPEIAASVNRFVLRSEFGKAEESWSTLRQDLNTPAAAHTFIF